MENSIQNEALSNNYMMKMLKDEPPFITDLKPNITEKFQLLLNSSLPNPHPFIKEDIPNLLKIARHSAFKKMWASTHVISILKDFADDLTEEQVVFLCPLLKDDPDHDEIIDKMPEILLIAACGDKAVRPLQIMLQYSSLSDDEKNVVLETMGEIKTDLARKTLLSVAVDMYRKNTPEVNGFLVSALVHSGVKEEGIPIIRKMFQDKLVDEFHMGAFDDVLIEMGLPLDLNDTGVRKCKHCNEPYALCQRNIRENRKKESKLAEENAKKAFDLHDYETALHLALKAKSLYITFDDDIIVYSLSNLERFEEALGVLKNSSARLFIDNDEKRKQKYKESEKEILRLYQKKYSLPPSTKDSKQKYHLSELHKKLRSVHYSKLRKHFSTNPSNAYTLSECEVTTGRWRHHSHEPFLPSCAFDERGFLYNESCSRLCYHNMNKHKIDSKKVFMSIHDSIASISIRGEIVATGGVQDYSVIVSRRTESEFQFLHQMKGHTDRVDCVFITHDKKKIISTSQSCGEIRVWDISSGKEDIVMYTGAIPSQIASIGNEIYVALQKFPYIQVFDLNTGKWINSFLGHSNRHESGDSNGCWSIAVNQNYLLSGSHKRELFIWSRQSRCILHKFRLKSSCAVRFALTEDYAVAGLQDGRIILLCLNTGSRVAQFRDHREVICGVHIQETKNYLAVYSAGVDEILCRRRFPSIPFDNSIQRVPVRKCMYCKKEEQDERFKRCSGCKLVLYCSKECQEKDWNSHYRFCKEHR